MELQPISQIKMWKLLKRYRGGKALGGDSLDGHLIKTASKVLLPALTHIVNLSIKEGTFLERWKFHVVLPHHKSGGREDPDNFRPVCHLVELGKLVELVVWEQLMSHTLQGQLLHPNHHGSLPGHSPITAICQVQEALTKAADAKQLAALVLLDQKAAFDLVDHSTLKAKMVEYGFGDTMLGWMGSYLHQRRYVVQVGVAWSHPRQIGDQGVPQGSVLGSLLFILSQGDLPDVSLEEDDPSGQMGGGGGEEGQHTIFRQHLSDQPPPTLCRGVDDPTTMYVDDTSSVVTASDQDNLLAAAQMLATRQAEWLQDNGMVVSPGKSKLLVCAIGELRRARLMDPPPGIRVQGNLVLPTRSERVLGLYFDQDLSWRSYLWGEGWRPKDNFPGLINILMGRAAILQKLSRILPGTTMPSLVAGIFMSKLVYAMEAYCHTWYKQTYRDQPYKAYTVTKSDITILQTLQNRALRCITGGRVRNTSTRDLLERTGYLSVHQLGAYLAVTSLHKSRLGGSPKWVANQLVPLQNTRTRKGQHQPIPARLNCREESYLPRSVLLYNQMPGDDKELAVKPFKDAAKKWIWANIPIRP